MNEIVTQEIKKNAVTGEGYRLDTANGRLAHIADFMRVPQIQDSIKAVLPMGSEAFVASVLNEIRKSVGDSYKDLSVCTPTSIMNCIIDAARMRISIDGKQHGHIIKRGTTATLQIGYRAYLERLQGSLPGFMPIVEVVYQGDDVEVAQSGTRAHLIHKPANPFGQRTDANIIGAYAYISWISGGERVSVITTMDRPTINKIMNAAQTKSIWNAWFSEKAKVAVLRRACKMHFASLTHDLDAANNDDFDLDNGEAIKQQTTELGSRIGAGLTKQAGMVDVGSTTAFSVDIDGGPEHGNA